MSRLLLLRHASHRLAGRGLAGRLPGLGLDEQGLAQAQACALALQRQSIAAVFSSPQQRTRETAEPVAGRLGLPVRVAPEFDEIDFGRWTGLPFEQVREQDPVAWDTWVNRRSAATPPGGEPFAQVQRRAESGVRRLRREFPDQAVLVVSHADVIKAVLATHLRMSLDDLECFEIGCASLSVLDVGEGWSQVKLVNGTCAYTGEPRTVS